MDKLFNKIGGGGGVGNILKTFKSFDKNGDGQVFQICFSNQRQPISIND